VMLLQSQSFKDEASVSGAHVKIKILSVFAKGLSVRVAA